MKKALVFIVASLVSATLASADDAKPPLSGAQAVETKAVQRFGDDKATCAEWSDGCVVCVRTITTSSCSLPGIACQPRPTACDKAVEPNAPH